MRRALSTVFSAMLRRAPLAAGAGMLAVAAACAPAADPFDFAVTGTDYAVDVDLTAAIPHNALFDMTVTVQHADGTTATDASLDVDAEMPAHNHGMNVEPVVSKTAPGVFSVTGMQLHMQGDWSMHFDVTVGEKTERITHKLTVSAAE